MTQLKTALTLSAAVLLAACSATEAEIETALASDNAAPATTAAADFPDPGAPEASGWTPERFDTWVRSRAGTGDPVHWYSVGTLRAFPGGELLYTLEGYDISNAQRVSDTMAEQYSRKIYIYRDAETGEVVREVNGEPVEAIAYPYQFITYELKDGEDGPFLKTFVEQGVEPRVQRIGPGSDITVRRIGDLELYTAPLFLDFPLPSGERYQTFENYDFVIPRDESRPGMITFMRYGPLPKFAQRDGITMGAMHMQTWRIEDYDDVPESLRTYVEADAPLWAEPPTDLADIRRLQGRPVDFVLDDAE